jgi:3-dehydroquinate synthetase
VSEVAGSIEGPDQLMDLIVQDKKVRRGRLTFILVRGIGEAFVAPDIDAADVHAFLAEKLEHDPEKLHQGSRAG